MRSGVTETSIASHHGLFGFACQLNLTVILEWLNNLWHAGTSTIFKVRHFVGEVCMYELLVRSFNVLKHVLAC